MEVKAHLNHLRVSSRKVRLVVDLIREMKIEEARMQLKFTNKKSSELLLKLLNSAVANAKNNFNLDESKLYISKIIVNDGKILKRWRPRAMGRSARISKRTSDIIITLDEEKNMIK